MQQATNNILIGHLQISDANAQATASFFFSSGTIERRSDEPQTSVSMKKLNEVII